MSDIEIMGEGVKHCEGPVACDDGSVILGEMNGYRVTRVRPDGSKHLVAQMTGAPNGIAVGPDGALYCCNAGGYIWDESSVFPVGVNPANIHGSIDRVNVATGKAERLYDSCDGVKFAGPNDIVFDHHGNFWFTDLGKPLGDRELTGGLYYAKPDGSSVKQVLGGVALNGVGLSPDGKTVYAAASYLRWIIAFPAGPAPQSYGHSVLTIPDCIVFDYPRRRLLDSMAIEADGTIAQAVCFENPGISRVNVKTGAETTVPFPDILTTNVAFGGKDMCTAYVTLTTTRRLAKMRWPAPGLRLPYNL